MNREKSIDSYQSAPIEMNQTVELDARLLKKYDRPLPRYPSYPPTSEFSADFDPDAYVRAVANGNRQEVPLSLYCHIPFCERACYFCDCNTIITQHKEVAEPYLGYLARQMRQVARLVSSDRLVERLHWGGGTPNFLDLEQIEFLWTQFNRYFCVAEDAEVSIEIDPTYVDRDYILYLRQLGFNHISLGVQDFDPQVQAAIARIQPESLLFNVMAWIREAGFDRVSIDLIYGLPFQTEATFQTTIRKILKLNPDRLTISNFAYVPQLKPLQKRMPASAMPSAALKLKILQQTIAQLTQNGYVSIGIDCFAKPNDRLSIAQKLGQLHCNASGYTTHPQSDLLAFGITGLSMLQDVSCQNHQRLKDFYRDIDADKLPIAKGIYLSYDDLIRRAVINELMCRFRVSMSDLAAKYHLKIYRDFNDYFAKEIARLDLLEADGLLHRWSDGITITTTGRLLIRTIAAVFDAYLTPQVDAIG